MVARSITADEQRLIAATMRKVHNGYFIHHWKLRGTIGLLRGQGFSYDDIESELHLAYVHAVRLWLSPRGCPFHRLVAIAFHRRLLGLLRSRRRVTTVSWPEGVLCKPHTELSFDDPIVLAVALQTITHRRRLILIDHYLKGDTLAKIAQRLGISYQRTLQLKNSALEQLRRVYDRESPALHTGDSRKSA
jgi:DNA-directed RNA polymerase specialized sigma24 family protein